MSLFICVQPIAHLCFMLKELTPTFRSRYRRWRTSTQSTTDAMNQKIMTAISWILLQGTSLRQPTAHCCLLQRERKTCLLSHIMLLLYFSLICYGLLFKYIYTDNIESIISMKASLNISVLKKHTALSK